MTCRIAFVIIGAVVLNTLVAWWCAIRANRIDMPERARVDSVLGYTEDRQQHGSVLLSLRHSGWPHRSMSAVTDVEKIMPESPRTRVAHSAFQGPISTGIEVESLRRRVGQRTLPRVILPLMPIWPGFVINTLFYALVFSSPWLAAMGLRNLRAIKSLDRKAAAALDPPEPAKDRALPLRVTSMLDPLSWLSLQLGLIAASGAVLYKASVLLDSMGLASLIMLGICIVCGGVSLRAIGDGGPTWAVSWLRVLGILSCVLPFVAGVLLPAGGGSRHQWSTWFVTYAGGLPYACIALASIPIIMLHWSLRQRMLVAGWVLILLAGFVLLGAPTLIFGTPLGSGIYSLARANLPVPLSGYATNSWIIAFFMFTVLAWYRLRVAAS